MKFWVIVTVLFCASFIGGQVPDVLQNGTDTKTSGCRMVYSFQSLDFKNLKSSLNKLDSDQVFTGMAYDPHSGTIFLSSPKVSGRRAAVSYFRVDKYKPGTLPKLTAYPGMLGEPECDQPVDHSTEQRRVHFSDLFNNFRQIADVDSEEVYSTEQENDDSGFVDSEEENYRGRKLLSVPEDEEKKGKEEQPEPELKAKVDVPGTRAARQATEDDVFLRRGFITGRTHNGGIRRGDKDQVVVVEKPVEIIKEPPKRVVNVKPVHVVSRPSYAYVDKDRYNYDDRWFTDRNRYDYDYGYVTTSKRRPSRIKYSHSRPYYYDRPYRGRDRYWNYWNRRYPFDDRFDRIDDLNGFHFHEEDDFDNSRENDFIGRSAKDSFEQGSDEQSQHWPVRFVSGNSNPSRIPNRWPGRLVPVRLLVENTRRRAQAALGQQNYPNYFEQKDEERDSKAIPYPHVSVYAIRVDNCQRLWVLDTGVNEDRIEKERCTDPSISIYDISSDDDDVGTELIQRISIPRKLYKRAVGFQNLVIDSDRTKCKDTVAYIANSMDNTILVYTAANHDLRLFDHPVLRPEDPPKTSYLNGLQYHIDLGVRGMAVGAVFEKNSRDLIFNPEAGQMHHAFSEKIRRSNTLAKGDILHFGSRGNDSVSPSSVFSSKEQVLFFGESNTNSLKCISNKKDFNPSNMVTLFQDKEHLNYPHAMMMDNNGGLFILSNEWPLFASGQKRRAQMDYAIFRCDTQELIKGTGCERPQSQKRGNPIVSYMRSGIAARGQ